MKKLAKTIKRQDTVTKIGLSIVASVILPACSIILYTVLFTNPVITFGSF